MLANGGAGKVTEKNDVIFVGSVGYPRHLFLRSERWGGETGEREISGGGIGINLSPFEKLTN